MRCLDLIFAARPLLHLPIWSIYLVSLHDGTTDAAFGRNDLLMLVCLNLLAGGAYYLNQVYDYESDRFNRKLGFLQTGMLTMIDLWLAFLICSIIAMGVGLLISISTVVLLAQFFVLGALYSLPPARLKDRPLAGLLVNAWSFGWLVSYAAIPGLDLHSTRLTDWFIPVYFILAVAATHVLTTLPDRVGDRATGKKTIAVVLPPPAAKLLALVLLAGSCGIAHYSQQAALAVLSLVSALAVGAALSQKSHQLELLAAKLPILLLTLLAGFYYPIYLLFVVVLILLTRLYYRQRFGRVYPQLA